VPKRQLDQPRAAVSDHKGYAAKLVRLLEEAEAAKCAPQSSPSSVERVCATLALIGLELEQIRKRLWTATTTPPSQEVEPQEGRRGDQE